MFQRKTTGSVVCPSCGSLVGVRDEKCYTCGRANPGLWGFTPLLRQLGTDLGFTPLVIGACVILYALTLLASRGNIGTSGLFSMLGPSTDALFLFGASGAIPVFAAGRWWTVLSAAWLHAGILHILFNMMAVRQLAPGVADLYGPSRTVIIYTAGAIVGFSLSSFAGAYVPAFFFLRGSGLTVGASASISGLIGALLCYGRRTGSSLVRTQAMSYVMMLVVYGFLMPGIDNYAHAGGFIGGYATSAFLNPMTRERGDHMLVALICLALTLASVIVSVLTGLKFIS